MKTDRTMEWLLEQDNPSVRYFTLVDLLDRPPDGPDVLSARRGIMGSPPVSRILASQKEGGYWGDPEKFYVGAKWRGTFFTLILLADLGADGDDPRVKRTCEFLLNHSQAVASGGFAQSGSRSGPGGDPGKVHPCMTGKMIWPLIRFGYLNDPRVRHGVRWIVKYQRFDDGGQEHPPEGWPYDWRSCWGRHTCLRGVVQNLKALAEIPERQRSESVRRTIDRAAEFILQHHVFKRSHDLAKVIKPEWQRFVFPTFGDIDTLEMLLILTKLGFKDRRMREAVDLVDSKQGSGGRWRLERSYNNRSRARVEQEGQPSKWITLRALTVLRRYRAGSRTSD